MELARLEYQLPRLTRMWTHLSRMGGGIGTRRGPGETQLETDRRVIRERIKKTRERVEEVRRRRETAARARERRLLPTMAIVGYTNAGKSTLLNALVGEEAAVVEDMLVRHARPDHAAGAAARGPDGHSERHGGLHPQAAAPVGRGLPGHAGGSDAGRRAPGGGRSGRSACRRASPHGADGAGRVGSGAQAPGGGAQQGRPGRQHSGGGGRVEAPGGVLGRDDRYALKVSALTETGIDELRDMMATVLADLWLEVDLAVPYSAGELLARVRERGTVEFEYRDDDVRIQGRVPPSMADDLHTAARAWERARKAREAGS